MKYVYGLFTNHGWAMLTNREAARDYANKIGGNVRRIPYRAWVECTAWDAPTFIVMSDGEV